MRTLEADVDGKEIRVTDPRGPSGMITCDHYLDADQAEKLIEELETAIEEIRGN